MKFTLKWLKNYLVTDADVEAIALKLNQLGLEVEKIIDNRDAYRGFIIAEIIDAQKHYDSDKLTVCQVNIGGHNLQIVCGAPNARAGIKVILAQVGAIIPSNGLKIKKSVIRGVESNGMLCSYDELNLPGNSAGIIEVDTGFVGQSFVDYFNLDDVIFEIAITPNRGDCASVYGIARDLAASGLGKLLEKHNQNHNYCFTQELHCVVDAQDACREVLFCYGKNVNNNAKAQGSYIHFLQATGYVSKTPLVDISNYIMFDMGRPNHVYDADTINGEIIVRYSKSGEQFVAIGGAEYLLPENLLVIADQEKILSIAGVIGGEKSKVTSNTQNILIEVAHFSPEAVMYSGRALGIITDSRFRFERNIDHANARIVMNQIIELISNTCNGEFSEFMQFSGDSIIEECIISFDPQLVKKLADIDISQEEIFTILDQLGFKKIHDGIIDNIKVPSWRRCDVTDAAGLVEEVIRIYGLENIQQQALPYLTSHAAKCDEIDKIRSRLLHKNLTEIISWSFVSSDIAQAFSEDELLILSNPISQDMSVMRPSIICSMAPVLQKNLARSIRNVNLFEIGNSYNMKFTQNQMPVVAGLRAGFIEEKNVHNTCNRPVDFFDVKDDVMSVLSEYNIDLNKYVISRATPHYYHPTRSAAFTLGKNDVAFCGELHPRIMSLLKIEADFVCCFEIFLDNIPKSKRNNYNKSIKLTDFQHIVRDLSFIVRRDLLAAELMKSVYSLKIELLSDFKLFDVYEGKGLEEGFKAVGLTVKIQPKHQNIAEEEIETIITQITQCLMHDHGARLRG